MSPISDPYSYSATSRIARTDGARAAQDSAEVTQEKKLSKTPRFLRSLQKDLGWIPKFVGSNCLDAAKNIKTLHNSQNLTPNKRMSLALKATLNILVSPLLVPFKALLLSPLVVPYLVIALIQAIKVQVSKTDFHGRELDHFNDWDIKKQNLKPQPGHVPPKPIPPPPTTSLSPHPTFFPPLPPLPTPPSVDNP